MCENGENSARNCQVGYIETIKIDLSEKLIKK